MFVSRVYGGPESSVAVTVDLASSTVKDFPSVARKDDDYKYKDYPMVAHKWFPNRDLEGKCIYLYKCIIEEYKGLGR